MSKTPRISYVVEGATDCIVLDALVELFLGTDDYVPTQIQPPKSEYANHSGPLGGGWKGVLKWCEARGGNEGGFENDIVLANCDLLLIHVDADIASEAELQHLSLTAPCPPAKETCDKLREHLLSLLGGKLLPKVIICIPAQCTEAWIVSALHPDEATKFAPIECHNNPESLLIQKPDRLVRVKDGAAKKQTAKYKEALAKIIGNWSQATAACEEASRFETECKTALSAIIRKPS